MPRNTEHRINWVELCFQSRELQFSFPIGSVKFKTRTNGQYADKVIDSSTSPTNIAAHES
jgi:desulfoferrodoxin (superoxide reductase-like protein)